MNKTIRPRRLFVSGASRLSINGAILWRQLGRLLAFEDGLTVITGGLKKREDNPSGQTADYTIIEGMLPVLHSQGVPTEKRIETFLPDFQLDLNEKLIRFKEGQVRMLKNRNAQSRRFSMVHSADVVISVEGDHGTRSVLDMALAIDRPILPLPFGGGASKVAWKDQREHIIRWFRIDSAEARDFEQIKLENLNEFQLQELAVRVYTCLMRGFTQGCFIIMRFHTDTDPVFDQAILPALDLHGFQSWRTDRSVSTGDIVEAIRDGIDHCYFAIADTTGDRPNVMYELGLVHAAKKPVILLRRENPDGSLPRLPFDFSTQKIVQYGDNLNDLRLRLETEIETLFGKLRATNEN